VVGDILQPTHLLFILIVALLVLGPKRLPELARTLGSGLRDFRAAINGERDELRDSTGANELRDFKASITEERDQLRDLKDSFSAQRDQTDTSAQADTQIAGSDFGNGGTAGSGLGDGSTQTPAGPPVSPAEPSAAEPSPPGGGLSSEPEPAAAHPAPPPPREPDPSQPPHVDSLQTPEAAAKPDPEPAPDPVTSLQHRD
jgi:TatA/E family protein of Tat protein translocase